jgi:hypothetical protein
MNAKWKRFSRRAFVGGAGVTLALPFLDSLVPRSLRVAGKAKAADGFPTRLVYVYVPNGLIRTNLKPREEGRGYTMPSLLEPLADVRDHFSVLTGISNKPGGGSYTYPDGTTSNDGPGDHARDTATFLTAARIRKTDGSDIRNGISVDQVAANALREHTPDIPSLVLSTRSGTWGGDSGYAPIYKANISWANETTPLPKETSPRAVFDRLFAGVDPTATLAEIERRQRLEQSVLDSSLQDLNSLRGQLATEDQRKLDEYLAGVRHLEVRLETSATMPVCDPGTAPGEPGNFEEHVDLFYDLIKLAFQCDRTRVVSLIMDKSGSFDFLGISEGHHQISHLDNGTSDVRKIETINQWQMESFGSLIRKLLSATEDDGTTLLDNSLVLFGGGLDGTGHNSSDETLTPQASGGVHRHTNLPLFLAGRGGGAHDAGRHIVYRGQEPVADLYIAMLHAAGVMVDSFAIEGTGPIAGLV